MSTMTISSKAQENSIYTTRTNSKGTSDLYGTRTRFVTNAGQYGDTLAGFSKMGPILYGYEGFDMPVLFTPKGIIHLQRKVKQPGEEERERMEKKGMTKEDIAKKVKVTDRAISIEWINANPNCKIACSDSAPGYNTYGYLQAVAYGFKKITYKDLYPGIDLEYFFVDATRPGFEYQLIVHPGADLSIVKFNVGGDVRSIKKDRHGNLIVKSDITGFKESLPISYYQSTGRINSDQNIASNFIINDHTISFHVNTEINKSETFILDPFVSSTSNLTGGNAGKAKDVDFDYAGNVFVTGGGDGNIYKMAKFDANGVLQWTFSGTLTVPAWTFGTYYGGWVVEKNSGNVYLGQGFAPTGGFRVIRLNAAGLYDNYITTANPNFLEDWKMLWSCNNGTPQIVIAGGGTNSNINIGVFSPPNTTLTATNVTNVPFVGTTGWAQDVVDIIIDPTNNDMYTIYASLIGTPTISNRIYKNPAPYTNTTLAWNVPSGFATLQEIANRPYFVAGQIDNSANLFAVNSNYLFYWDGKNLKAFNKATGAGVGTPLAIAANVALMQGGIIADECNNIFVGFPNGTIKVYKFNGTIFDDALQPDITIPGFALQSVYDLVLNNAQHLLYACGDGFVASFDISSYSCGSAVYSVNVLKNCSTNSATASISPAPPAGSTVTYLLYNGVTQIASNTTGVFNNLSLNVNYSMHAIVNQVCSGTETITNFTIAGPVISNTVTNTTCGNATGIINLSSTGGVGAVSYSINGTNFFPSGTFNSLTAGSYTVYAQDANGCLSSSIVSVANSNGPALSVTKTDAFCGTASGTITITGSLGTAPYQYSLNNGAFQTSNAFSGLSSGSYIVTIRDNTGCTNSTSITLNSTGGTTLAANPLAASCGNSNGSVTAVVSGGTPPYLYSINGVNYQVGDVFTGLPAGTYSLTIKDAVNCFNSTPFTIVDQPAPLVTATTTPSSCSLPTGTITVSSTGGKAPVLFSVNGGVTFQAGLTFSGLTAGTYTIIARDANGCQNTVAIAIGVTTPQVAATATAATCGVNDGVITATGTGGILPYLFSLDGITFQASTVFSGLASGTYNLIIKDAAGCTHTLTSVVVPNANGLTIAATSTVTSCSAPTGTIILVGTGGVAPLQYSINGVSFQSSGSFTAVAAGTYNVIVKDAGNCTAKMLVTVTSVNPPSVTATATATSCNNPNGSITALGSSGTSPYVYSINGVTYQTSNVFSALAQGVYTVSIKDAINCTATTTVIVSNVGGGSGPTVTATTTAAECGQANGRIDANGNGGKNPKKYSIDGVNFQGSTTFNNVPPGVYTVIVRDDNGCINTVTVTVGNIAGPQVSAVVTPASCGSVNGTINATGFSGTAPYRYSIDGGVTFQPGTLFTGLSAGSYTLTVRDADNVCRNSIIVVIPNSNGPTVATAITNASCSTNNGTITINAGGGTAPYTYSLDGVNFQVSNFFTGLTSGSYSVVVKDATNCSNASTVSVTAVSEPIISVSPQASTCGNSNGKISVSGTNGTTPYKYSIDGITFQVSSVFSGLASGPYAVTLKDANNCVSTTNVTLGNIPGPSVSTTTTDSYCNKPTGKLIATVTSGTMPYQYSLDAINYQPGFLFTGLVAGTVTLTVKDSNNCISTSSVLIPNVPGPTITLTDSISICGTGNIVVTSSGGAAPFVYSIDGTTYQTSNVFPCLAAGSYSISIKDTNDCISTGTIVLLGAPLPITLLAFDATARNRDVKLAWSTATEINNDYFTVERSNDAINFYDLLTKDGAGTSTLLHSYEDFDLHPLQGVSYYRLKQTDFDGKFAYSDIISVRFDQSGNSFYGYYDPKHQSIHLVSSNGETDLISVQVMDMAGQIVAQSDHIKGKDVEITMPGIASGMYALKIEDFSGPSLLKIVVN